MDGAAAGEGGGGATAPPLEGGEGKGKALSWGAVGGQGCGGRGWYMLFLINTALYMYFLPKLWFWS